MKWGFRVRDVCFYLEGTQTYTAFHVLQFWQNVQGETISLPARPIASIHVVSKSQHQAEHLQYTLTGLQSLVHAHTQNMHTNK